MKKINILVVQEDTQGGVGFYRSFQPHEKLVKMFPDEFEVTYETSPKWNNCEFLRNFDIIHFHKGVSNNYDYFIKALEFCKENNIVTICDIDDYWVLGEHHPGHSAFIRNKTDKMVVQSLMKADYVTTTTKLFKDKILPLNKKVEIIPNSIDPTDNRFAVNKKKCNKIRIGMIMGSSHWYDLLTMNNFVKNLPREILDKIEFVLCGFDLRGEVRYIDANGKMTSRNLTPHESVWYNYEQYLTDNYNIISPQYHNFLEQFIPYQEYPHEEQEGYKRRWTKNMDHYYEHFSEIDVLLAPLEENDFNKVKSQLKVIEAAFSHSAIIATNFGPYTLDLKNIFVKGGGIDKTGNAILIDPRKAHKEWYKAIEKIVKNPELIPLLQDNLYNDIHEKYDLNNVTKQRAEFYRKIIKK